MAGSAIVQMGAIPGLMLRAWALVQSDTGTLVKGYNVASVVRNATGNYSLTLTSNMPDTNVIAKVEAAHNGAITTSIAAATVGTVNYLTYSAGATADLSGARHHWVGIYG